MDLEKYTETIHLLLMGNECGDGKLAGALVGGGAGAALSRGDGRWWAIPLGILVGSTVGCDMAGG